MAPLYNMRSLYDQRVASFNWLPLLAAVARLRYFETYGSSAAITLVSGESTAFDERNYISVSVAFCDEQGRQRSAGHRSPASEMRYWYEQGGWEGLVVRVVEITREILNMSRLRDRAQEG